MVKEMELDRLDWIERMSIKGAILFHILAWCKWVLPSSLSAHVLGAP